MISGKKSIQLRKSHYYHVTMLVMINIYIINLWTSSKYVDGEQVETKYGYDLYGNQTETSFNGTYKIYHYNKRNQLTNIKTQYGLTDNYYNKNGNMKEILYAGGKKETLEYDEFDQLIKLSNSKDQSFEYEYDAQGDRIGYKKNINEPYDAEAWYKYLEETPYDEVKELLEDKNSSDSFDALRYQAKYHADEKVCVGDGQDNNVNYPSSLNYVIDKSLENSEVLMSDGDVKHIYGMNERLITECGDPMMSYESSIITYMNGLNDSVVGTNTAKISFGVAKNTENKFEYDDFGKTNDIRDGFGYNGEELDSSGLIYLRARYYNPELGRFIQIDSYKGKKDDVESQNRYIYTNNNPYKYIDKNGHMTGVEETGAGILIGIGVVIVGTVAWLQSGGSKTLGHAISETWNSFKTSVTNTWDGLKASYQRGQHIRNEMIADTLINNDTITISGGYSSWAGSTTPRPTITMSREQYLRDIACQEVKDIYARKLAEEADAVSKSVSIPTSEGIPAVKVPTYDETRKKLKEKTGDLSESTGLGDAITKVIRRVIELNKRNRTPASHHIVPWQFKKRAKVRESIEVLVTANIDYINGPENRVTLPTSFHAPLHTDAYTESVYWYISPEYRQGLEKMQLYPHVFRRLNDIRIVLQTAARIAMPF